MRCVFVCVRLGLSGFFAKTINCFQCHLHSISNVVGGFSSSKLIEGKIAKFQMWDHEKTADEIRSFDCRSKGNLLTMGDMYILGFAMFSKEQVPCTRPGMSAILQWHILANKLMYHWLYPIHNHHTTNFLSETSCIELNVPQQTCPCPTVLLWNWQNYPSKYYAL